MLFISNLNVIHRIAIGKFVPLSKFFFKLEETKLGFFILLLNSLLRISNFVKQLSFISSIFWLVMKINGN